MLKNYFLIAWRSLVRNSTLYFINIFSLSIGLACCLLISAYLYSELTYDTYPEHAKDIYRVDLHVTGNGSVVDYPYTDWAPGPGMKNAYGEVVSCTRLTQSPALYLGYGENTFKETHIALADSNFLEFFSIPMLEGDLRTALQEPYSIVVTRAFAQKYFGNENPVGKILRFDRTGEVKVTALIDKVPDQSHFHFDAFISLSTFRPRWMTHETWSNIGVYTYLRLNPNSDVKMLEGKFRDLVLKYVAPEIQHDMGVSLVEAQKSVDTFVFSLQPLLEIHLYSHTRYELEPNGDIKYIYIFSALAAFILLLACVNFINLSTATSSRRAREVGIRKVMGSAKAQLIYQFLSESILLSGFAMILAYAVVVACLPYFNQLTGKSIVIGFFLEPVTLLVVLGALLLVGVAAGIYPAFFLSSFKTVSVLKGNMFTGPRREGLRSSLVVFQFAVSTALTIATLVVYQQLHFMQNKKLGYDKDQVLVVEDSYVLRANEKVLKEQFLKDSRVSAVSITRQIPGQTDIDGTQAYPKDKLDAENNAEIHINIYHVDYDFLSTLGIELKSGRNLSLDFPSDSAGIVINETAAREFGWDADYALNRSIIVSGQTEYHVVGVVKDFNYASVRQKIAPLVMMLSRNRGMTLVKVKTEDISGFLKDARKKWDAFSPEAPFTYTFLDESFAALYSAEERTGMIFTTFAVIALLIAGLGLFGLSAFTAEQRTKEIGIRKVLGASVGQVLFMLSRQFLGLVLIAFVVAVPFVVWAMNQWLSEFAYRIKLEWWVFLLAGVLSLLIAFVSMSFQAIRAAVADPVESLKME